MPKTLSTSSRWSSAIHALPNALARRLLLPLALAGILSGNAQGQQRSQRPAPPLNPLQGLAGAAPLASGQLRLLEPGHTAIASDLLIGPMTAPSARRSSAWDK